MSLSSRTATLDDLRDDAVLLEHTMIPYASRDTIYLKRATTHLSGGAVVSEGDFGFQNSCYIEETGHFNAVEFIISYNQLIYYTLAAAVRDRLIPELEHWTMQDYWDRQLPSVLISKMSTRYRQPINARCYQGHLRITDVEFRNRSRPLLALQTSVEFSDTGIGSVHGDVEIVLIDLPAKSG